MRRNKLFWLYVFIVATFLSSKAIAQVTANFSASPLTGCAPLTVQFTDQSTGSPNSWNWNFGNSNTSTLQNPGATYVNPGVYTVTLTASNGSSTNTATKTAYINVYAKANAGFNMSNDTVCVGDPVTFTDASIISSGGATITQWGWDFGDGNTQNTITGNVSHSYNNAGSFPISLIITDANGCTSSIIQTIVVIPKPTVNFTANPTSSCTAPVTVTFTNTSTTLAGASYLWRFGDGSTSTLSNPTHTYTALGLYTVTLIITQNGCVDSLVRTNYIQIQAINAAFSATPTTACAGKIISFTNNSIPAATSASWTFGDGGSSASINPSYIYNVPGIYSVTLIVTDASGCKDTLTQTNYITVDTTPIADFTPNNVSTCKLPFTVNFTNTSTNASSFNWSFGDGGSSASQNPSHTYNSIGNNTVTLIVSNSTNTCFDTVAKTNFINYNPPVAAFSSLPDSGCAPLIVNFTDASTSTSSPIVTYYWNYGDGTLDTNSTTASTHTYTNTGVYTVTYIVETANGCRDTVVCINCIKVGNKPNAAFGIVDDTVCYGLPVSFIDSTAAPVTGWFWQFGDGATSTVQNPNHVYGQPGNYNAYLIAYHNGCPDTSVIKPVVILPPKAQFSTILSCTNYYLANFTSTSIGADSIFWDFGDGTQDSSNTINVSHTYINKGTYAVTLTAYNFSSGCTNSATVNITIAEPIASFTQSSPSGCYPLPVIFTNTSQDAVSYFWSLGNGAPVTTINTSTTYVNPGSYPVMLIITDVNGCKDTATSTVIVYGAIPAFYADTLKGCTPLPVTFFDNSTSDSTMVQWIWNYGDGNIDTTTSDSIIHTYINPGMYTVTMTVTDKNGCSKTISYINYIRPTFPQPAFTVDTFACKGDLLTFNAAATIAAGGGIFIWDFDDGTIDTTNSTTITHTFTSDNIYNLTLTVIDSNGCDSSVTINVRIEKPTANFNWSILNSGCGTLQVAFIDSSYSSITAWQWNFGNGATSTLQNPVYTYTAPGIYNVTLIVTNGGGCKDTLRLDSIIVVSGPIGTFTFAPTNGCAPLTVTFIALSNNSQQYIWDFGDGVVVNGNDTVIHTYTYQGTFNPILVLGNILPNGNPCLLPATNLTGSVNVVNTFNTNIIPASMVIPEDSMASIQPVITGNTFSPAFSWTPTYNVNCPTCQNVLITGSGDTIMYYFYVVDSNGCAGFDSILIYSPECITKELIPNVFTPDGDGKNDYFYIPGVCSRDDFSLHIYDRWGITMFGTRERHIKWDGRTMTGQEAPSGVYYFIVKIGDKTYPGFVQLLR